MWTKIPLSNGAYLIYSAAHKGYLAACSDPARTPLPKPVECMSVDEMIASSFAAGIDPLPYTSDLAALRGVAQRAVSALASSESIVPASALLGFDGEGIGTEGPSSNASVEGWEEMLRQDTPDFWACSLCTVHNKLTAKICTVCCNPNPGLEPGFKKKPEIAFEAASAIELGEIIKHVVYGRGMVVGICEQDGASTTSIQVSGDGTGGLSTPEFVKVRWVLPSNTPIPRFAIPFGPPYSCWAVPASEVKVEFPPANAPAVSQQWRWSNKSMEWLSNAGDQSGIQGAPACLAKIAECGMEVELSGVEKSGVQRIRVG
jgi:hypothetical protein